MSDDAERLEIAKNSLEVLSQASELASKFAAVDKILKIADKLSASFPFVGAVLGLIQGLLPDPKHEEILRRFDELSNKIDKVRDDIKDLEKMIKWELTELQYGVVVDRIELGMQYCFKMGKGSEQDEKMRYQERLKEVCANQNFTLALNALFDGMTGNGLFRSSILDDFYSKTGGDRPKISALAIRLLQLVCGGMMVIATYETVMRGREGAEEVAKGYDTQLKEVYAKVQSVLDRCVGAFSGNMLNDLNKKLDEGGSNTRLTTKIKDFMRDKYDWLEICSLVYNDLQGFDKHCFNGSRVDSLHRNGKCGIVFYRTKGEPPKFTNRYSEAYKIVNDAWCANAKEGYNNIVANLGKKGIGWTGCSVSKHSDLRRADTFSSTIVDICKKNAIAILLLE